MAKCKSGKGPETCRTCYHQEFRGGKDKLRRGFGLDYECLSQLFLLD